MFNESDGPSGVASRLTITFLLLCFLNFFSGTDEILCFYYGAIYYMIALFCATITSAHNFLISIAAALSAVILLKTTTPYSLKDIIIFVGVVSVVTVVVFLLSGLAPTEIIGSLICYTVSPLVAYIIYDSYFKILAQKAIALVSSINPLPNVSGENVFYITVISIALILLIADIVFAVIYAVNNPSDENDEIGEYED